MSPILKSILAVVVGAIAGSLVNMGIIMLSSSIIPPPEGADVTTMEGLKASMHLFKPINFLMPFLAHALGTMVGAMVAAFMVVDSKRRVAFILGFIFMAGGITTMMDLPSPIWFNIVDIVGAYLPFAYLGGYIAIKKS
ncbi:MAG: hypothetical protein ABI851_11475 [Saprospiraceae bacterium]